MTTWSSGAGADRAGCAKLALVDAGKHEAVLIADADETSRSTLGRVLRSAGYGVQEAETGEGALGIARSTMPVAVILEVPLPGLSGYEVCHTLRSEVGRALPVLFLSGIRTEWYDRIAGLLLGADDYMVKPYAAGELLARLARLIERARVTAPRAAHDLTPREFEVLGLMSEGLRHEQIARRLFISPKTVATHVEHILRKLAVRSSTEAIAVAFRQEILGSAPPLSHSARHPSHREHS
jgi:DNA-binding NarL/FixJ family response regulator